MRAQTLNIFSGMAAFGIAGAGIVYLALLTLQGFRVIQTVSGIPPIVTGATLASIVFACHFTDSLMVYMSESYALYQENLLRAERAKYSIGLVGVEPEGVVVNQPLEPAMYTRDLIVRDKSGTRTVPMDVPLTEKEILWADVLIRAWLHAWNIGAVDSESLSGPGKPINQKGDWVKVSGVWEQMDMVKKSNKGTEQLVTFEQALDGFYGKLRSVKLPDGKPPKLPPLPSGMHEKYPRLKDKA